MPDRSEFSNIKKLNSKFLGRIFPYLDQKKTLGHFSGNVIFLFNTENGDFLRFCQLEFDW